VYASFVDAINEGIQNLQARVFIGFVVDEEDKPIGVDAEMAIYERCIKAAQKIDPDFTFHLIIQGLRFWDNKKLKEYVDEAYEAKKKYKDLVIGFDLVSEEANRKAQDFAEVFMDHLKIQDDAEHQMPFIFHGGECLELENDNLFDLILMKSPRIGHGINLIKHSYMFDLVKKNNICIEGILSAIRS